MFGSGYAGLGDSLAALLDTLRPSLIVLGHDAFTIERTLVGVARSRGIPTVALIHGGVGYKGGYRELIGDADYKVIWGQEDLQGLIRHGVDRNRIKLVGSIQFDKRYREVACMPHGGDDRQHQISARRALELPTEQPMVMFMTSNIHKGMILQYANPAVHRKVWREFVALASRRSDLTFVIKPHPSYDHFEFYRYLCRSGPSNLMLLENVGLDVALAATDIGVLVNCCTTAALEAMLAKVPVVFLRVGVYTDSYREDTLKEHGTIPVFSVDELEHTIDRLSDDPSFRKETLGDAELLMAFVLGERGQPAMDRMMIEFGKIALPRQTRPESEAPTAEQQVNLQLTEAARLLWEDDQRAEFLEGWRRLVNLLTKVGQPKALAARALFAITYLIGTNARSPAELRRLAELCSAALGSDLVVSREDARRLLLNAYLVATIRNADAHHWGPARAFVWQALRDLRCLAIRSSVFRRFFVKSLVGSSRMMPGIINRLEWANWRVAHSRPAAIWKSSREIANDRSKAFS